MVTFRTGLSLAALGLVLASCGAGESYVGTWKVDATATEEAIAAKKGPAHQLLSRTARLANWAECSLVVESGGEAEAKVSYAGLSRTIPGKWIDSDEGLILTGVESREGMDLKPRSAIGNLQEDGSMKLQVSVQGQSLPVILRRVEDGG